MDSIVIELFVESRYKINRKRLKESAKKLLKEQGIQGPAEVNIAIVGDRKMRELSRKFKGEDKTRNVLSFPLSEGPSTMLPSDILRLGDVVISYPEVIREAARDEIMVDDRVEELALHG